MATLEVIHRDGPEEFSQTLAFQTELLGRKTEDRALADGVIFVEHEPVYTVGRKEPFQEPLPVDGVEVPWHEIGRGGQATFHGPGQLVAYPIFDLNTHGKDVHVFLRNLEKAIIRALKHFDIKGVQREGLTGIWVDDAGEMKKIASIGVGVKRWVSYHGLALNVTTDLRYFEAISACGQDGAVMTSIEAILARRGLPAPQMDAVKQALVAGMQKIFGFEDVQNIIPRVKKRPEWLKVKAPGSPEFNETNDVVRNLRLVTVCEEAKCPNIGECWSHHTATFMIMGELCTRRCHFCSVKDGTSGNLEPLDTFEPARVGQAVAKLELEHVVITSVNRDDVEDMGADHFLRTCRSIRHCAPNCNIELLIPDMRGKRELLEIILSEPGLVSVLNHNVETVPRLYRNVRPGAIFERSLDILRWARELDPAVRTKSGVMVGLGEGREEVLEVMDQLRSVDCNIMTIGQYLQPTPQQLPVYRFVTPEEFEDYRVEGEKRGFSHIESGPFVRSSYHAWKHVEEADTRDSAEELQHPSP